MDCPAPSSERDWNSLSPDIQERILLRLPVSASIRLASVCKLWHATISSPSFTAQLLQSGKRPWFFLWGINELIHTRSVAFTFDPVAGCWFRLRTTRPPDFNRASLGGAPGILFAFSGSRVCFAPTPTSMKWRETSPATATRCSALVGIFGCAAGPSPYPFQLVVVGGVLDGDDRSVELYDSASDSWEQCPPLPETGFFEGISSHWMSSAVLGHNFYVADIYSGDIACFDVAKKAWSEVTNLRIPDAVHLFITSCEGGLYAVGVCHARTLKLFRVNELTMECEMVSEMPSDLFSIFEDEGELKEANLKCVGSGNLIYIYSESYYKGYPVCICDLSGGFYQWKQLPALPSPLPRFDRVVCCSTELTAMACLRTLKEGLNVDVKSQMNTVQKSLLV